jgi:microcystin-dependent protein
MSQPFIGEIRMFGGNFAPAGWAFCSGQLLAISENDALFALIGTTYGGDGQSTFALPDLRGRVPLHQGGGFVMGEQGGVEQVTLTTNQIPQHTHALLATLDEADRRNPQGAVFARPIEPAYAPPGSVANMGAANTAATGGSQPHNNQQPFLCVHFIISLFGIFPSQA